MGESLNEEGIAKLGEDFKTGNLVERRIAFAEMLKGLTAENALQLRAHIADLPQDSPEFREFHYAWGAVAGDEAVLHGKETQKKDMAASLAGWASKDPSAALAYFDSLSPAEQSNGADMKWGAIYGLADADPELASGFAVRRFENGDKDAPKMIRLAAAAVMKEGNRDEVTQWAQGIPDGPVQNSAFQHLADQYARENPAEALSWASDLPTGEGKNHALGSTFHQWAERDARAAAEALSSLPPGERDAATYGFATRVVHKDPAVGVDWAANIRDPESRNRALVDTGRVFYKRNREAAQQWLANANLPETVVQGITGGGGARD